MTHPRHVAVLGAGIMGSSTAIFLARRGVRVTMFDQAAEPFGGASRWNEGKIHLGHLYSASGALDTAKALLPGGLLFSSLVEELTGCRPADAATDQDDTYLVHRDSVTTADAMHRYLQAVTEMAASHPDADRYLPPLSGVRIRRLTRTELESDYDTNRITAGFQVPERSVSTAWVADRYVEALHGEPLIEILLRSRVRSVCRDTDTPGDKYFVGVGDDSFGPFDGVVNALWEGRLAVDAQQGIVPPTAWSHRYRLSVFLRTARAVALPSTVITTGPFGDIKNYNERDFYLSWYPAGLVAEGGGVEPPAIPRLDGMARERIIAEVLARLGEVVTRVSVLPAALQSIRLEGGWVYAAGKGPLSDRTSTLHRRDRAGILCSGSYVTVDTGKYSIAPWLARRVVDSLCGERIP